MARPNPFIKIEEVARGIFITNKPPTPTLLESGTFLTSEDFARAGEAAHKSANYGSGVLANIALQSVMIEAPRSFIMRGEKQYDLYWRIFYMMHNPDKIKEGSRDRLLLATQLAYEVIQASERRISNEGLPTLGKVGQRILNCLLFDDPQGEDRGEREDIAMLDDDTHE